MKQRNTLVAGVLVLCLAVTAILLLAIDSGVFSRQPSPAPDQPQQVQHIRINEICAKNETILADNDGRYPDYIELYNTGAPINLKGYTLTDGVNESIPFGDLLLDTGEYRVIFLGNNHTGFGIGAAGGDYIQLLDSNGAIAAQATVLTSAEDQVMLWDGSSYALSFNASPGFPNNAAGVSAFRNGTPSDAMQIVISEVLVTNDSSLADENGIFSDVVELHNIGETALALSGWYLSDSSTDRYRYRLPDITLPANGYLLLFCDGENYTGVNGELHANFGLSLGEELCLTDNAGNYHCITPEYPGADISLSRQADGTYKTSAVSLGYPNDETGAAHFAQTQLYAESPLLISEVLLSSGGVPYNGTLCDVVEILNRTKSTVSTADWYLTDDSDPYQYPLPQAELAPGECMVIVCGRGETGFSLSDGEILRLTAPNSLHAPLVTCLEGSLGESISLQLANEDMSYSFAPATLGYENLPENNALYLESMQPKGLMISEAMSTNRSYLQGAYGTTCDWIELYNNSDAPILLSDYTLTDSRGNLQKYSLPEKEIAPGQYMCILLSEDDTNLRSGYDRLPFTLSSSGEELYLSKDGRIEDFVFLPELDVDTAYGRAPGSVTFSILSKATPDKVNSQTAAFSAPVTAVTAPGSYNGVEYLDITLSAPGTIYYTTNCNTPSRSAKLYTDPIRVTKTTVLRVVCYEEGKQASQVVDLTYLLNENDSLSVVSVVTSPDNLWNWQTGIYVDGPGWTEEYPHKGANYWEDWERSATITLMDKEGEGFVSVPCGLKIFGGFSRANAKKSFACMFRASYGASELDYPVFGDEGLDTYEALVLRSGGQDTFLSRIRDEAVTSFVNQELGIPVQKYKPVVVYLNGAYYGIYFIREKVNENYVAGNYQAAKEDVLLTYWSGNTCPAFQELIDYVKRNGLTEQKHYDYVASVVDLQNYTDYMIAQMWIANTDTPNIKFFSTPEQPWTWILYDTDLSFRVHTYDSVSKHLNPNQLYNNDTSCKTLLLYLLRNEDYRDSFIRRIAWQVNNVWTEDKFIAHLNAVEAEIKADVRKDCQRWGDYYESWQRSVESIRTFTQKRNPYFLDSVQSYFDLTDRQMADYGFILEN